MTRLHLLSLLGNCQNFSSLVDIIYVLPFVPTDDVVTVYEVGILGIILLSRIVATCLKII